jgi:hypothetical protein
MQQFTGHSETGAEAGPTRLVVRRPAGQVGLIKPLAWNDQASSREHLVVNLVQERLQTAHEKTRYAATRLIAVLAMALTTGPEIVHLIGFIAS